MDFNTSEIAKILEKFGFKKKEQIDNKRTFYYIKGRVSVYFGENTIRYDVFKSGILERFNDNDLLNELASVILFSELPDRERKLLEKVIERNNQLSETITHLRLFNGLHNPVFGEYCNQMADMYYSVLMILFRIDENAGILECQKVFEQGRQNPFLQRN